MPLSLDQINAEADKKYQPFVITDVPGGDVELRHVVRLAKSERAQLSEVHAALLKAQDASDVEAVLLGARMILVLLSVGDGGKRLLEQIGEDVGKLTYILECYAEDTQMGEALRSAS